MGCVYYINKNNYDTRPPKISCSQLGIWVPLQNLG